MKPHFLILSAALLLATACRKDRRTETTTPVEDIVTADTKSSSLDFKDYRSSPADRIESMYAEMLKEDKELQALEKRLSDLQKAKADSVGAWDSYLTSISSYYSAAFKRVDTTVSSFDYSSQSIADSTLSARLRTVLEASQARQTMRMREHDALVAALENNSVNVEDRHKALKVMLTLKVIETYQLENMPSLKGIQNVDREQKAAQSDLDTKLKKTGL